jgi:hypothetical protein
MTPINEYEAEKETSKLHVNKDIESASSYITLSDNFKHCRLIHVQILKLLYKENRPVGFPKMYEKLKVLGTEKTVRNKINELESWGLIDVIHTRVLIVSPIIGKEKDIVNLVTSFYNKMGDTF